MKTNPFGTAKKQPAKKTSGEQPVAEIVIKLGDLTIGTQPIWAESKSRIQAYNDMNDMARDEPEKFISIMEQYRDKLTFEIRTSEPSGTGFEEFLQSL